jgi:sarcosine oxidase/L-pipecolate oxidase
LRASKAVNALQELFIKYGGHLVDGVRVIDVIPGDVVTLRTERGDYRGRNVVLTAGSWTNKLTETIGLTLPLKPVQIEVLYWEAKDPEAYHYSQFPCFINLSFDFYGSPIFEYDNVIKACTHEGVAIDPDAPPPHRDLTTSRTKDVMSTNLCRYFKNIIHTQPSSMETCIYTMTPDSDPIIDRHPQYSNIIIGAGFSGHGFKLGPVIGKILSDMISSLPITYDMSHFKIDRFL